MKLKLEIAALILGLVGAGIAFLLISFWGVLPVDIREFFRGGNLGGQLIGVFIIIGLSGFIIMIFNLLTGLRSLWWLRLLAYIGFIFLTLSFGLSV